MSERTTYEIVLRGQPSHRLLRPLIDDFAIRAMSNGTTRLEGPVDDPAQLHGIVAHLTSMNLEIVSIVPAPRTQTASKGNNMTTINPPVKAVATVEPGTETKMQAITQDRYGTAEVVALETISRPSPAKDEVLIEIIAAGVDRGTCHLMTGTPYLIRIAGYGLTKPKNTVLGLDVAGRVVAVGADVTRFAPGDEVFGIANGSLAEYAVAKESKLAHKPTNLSFGQAAVSAVSGITALQALTDVGDAQPGQRVLIIGASGGVGSFAIQIAKALGTNVTAIASTRNLEFMRSLGADHVVDYKTEDFTDIAEPFDLILDIGGRNSIRRLRSVLTTTGTLVVVGGENGNRLTGGVGRQIRASMLSPFLQQRLTMFVSKEHFSHMEKLADFITTGAVTPAIQTSYPLADTATALDQLDSGMTTGKSVIIIGDDGAHQ